MNPKPMIEELTRRNVEAIAKMEQASHSNRAFGERIADAVAHTVGSWPFIIIQSVLLCIWIILNVVGWFYQWDPYPFILLNLVLSFQAAYATPIIMMSQNRQAQLDERRNRLDLQVNLLAEQENTEMLKLLRLLCEKAGIPMHHSAAGKVFEQAICPEMVISQIESSGVVVVTTDGPNRT
jgi:uncharacterized membrane protein